MTLSPPSSEKRFAPMNFVWRNCSKISASVSFVRTRSCLSCEIDAVARRLHRGLQPLPRFAVVEERVLDADGARVGRVQTLEDLAERRLRDAEHVAGGEGRVERDVRETVAFERELGLGLAREAEGIEIGEEVAADAVGVHEGREARLELGRGLQLARGGERATVDGGSPTVAGAALREGRLSDVGGSE